MAKKTPLSRLRATQSSFRTHCFPSAISVIVSSDPKSDSETLIRLLPGRFDIEECKPTSATLDVDDTAADTSTSPPLPLISKPSCVFLVGKQSNESEVSQTLVFMNSVQLGNAAGENHKDWGRCGFIPDSTLVIDEDEFRSMIAVLPSKSDPRSTSQSECVFLRKVILPTLDCPSFIAMVKLGGGGVILFLSPAFLDSPEGRTSLFEFLATAASRNTQTDSMRIEAQTGEVQRYLDSARPVESSKPPPFPSLDVNVINNSRIVSRFQMNSRLGVPIESDFFVGQALILMRPSDPNEDPFYNEKIFSKKKRRIEVQFQGKLKYTPRDTIYIGAEVSEQMKLGLVSKGLCNMLLKLLSKIGTIHYSFGDKNNVEMAHISFPVWTTMDKIVVTKPGDMPPTLGDILTESQESVTARKASKTKVDWNTHDIYSMSFNSMYLDLPTWHLVNLSVMRDIDLRAFWGDSLLRLVLYEKGGNENEERHIQKYNKYLLCIQIKYLGIYPDAGDTVKDDDSLPWDKARPGISRGFKSYSNLVDAANSAEPKVSSLLEIREEEISNYDDDDSDTSGPFFDAEEPDDDVKVGEDGNPIANDTSALTSSSWEGLASIPRRNTVLPPDLLCPGWIEMCKPKGRYSKVFAFVVRDNTQTVFHTSSDFARIFDIANATDSADASSCSPRTSSTEKLRRLMGQTLAQYSEGLSPKQVQIARGFARRSSKYNETFLRRPARAAASCRDCGSLHWSGFAARALSERHWIEEWAEIDDRHVSFFHPEKTRPTFRISLQGIINVTKLCPDDCPNFPGFYFLSIETIGRTAYLMASSASVCDCLVDILSRLASSLRNAGKGLPPNTGGRSTASKGTGIDSLLALDDPTAEFLHKSSMWKCKQRKILNCRKFSFSSLGQDGACKGTQHQHPCDLVAAVLRRALEPMEESEDLNLRAFLDIASELKAVSVTNLSENERLAFFLNLYHVMVMHAFLVLGVPTSSFKWVSYFNMIAYQCSDDVFSLTELEHCIIRAGMSYPSQFVSKFVLPQSSYRFALTRSDFRINFALNCGSLSNPKNIPIYRDKCLSHQLDFASRSYLKDTVRIIPTGRFGGVSVTLPRICQWYSDDFATGKTTDMLGLIENFLDKDRQDTLLALLSEKQRSSKPISGKVTVKFLPYDFTCRHLTLWEECNGT